MDFSLNSCCVYFSLKTGAFWSMEFIMCCAIAALSFVQTDWFLLIIIDFDPKVLEKWQLFATACLIIIICGSISGIYATFRGQRDYLYGPLFVYAGACIVLLVFLYKIFTSEIYSSPLSPINWTNSNVGFIVLTGFITFEIILVHTWLVVYSYYKRFS